MRILATAAAVLSLAMIAEAACAAEITVPLAWGSERGKIGFYNVRGHDFDGAESPKGPVAISVDRAGNVVVADTFNKRIQVFSLSGRLLSAFGDAKDPKFAYMEDVAIGPDGSIAFIESSAQQIVVLSRDGKFQRAFGVRGEGPGQFLQAQKLAVASNGTILVGDWARNQILMFSADGKFRSEVPWNGNGFALDAKDRLVTLEYDEKAGYSVVTSDASGRSALLFMIWRPELTRGQILGCDKDGNVAVSLETLTASREATVTRYRPDGKPISQTKLSLPEGNRMAVYTPEGRLVALACDPVLAPKSEIKVVIR